MKIMPQTFWNRQYLMEFVWNRWLFLMIPNNNEKILNKSNPTVKPKNNVNKKQLKKKTKPPIIENTVSQRTRSHSKEPASSRNTGTPK